jgi:hypothetical protein
MARTWLELRGKSKPIWRMPLPEPPEHFGRALLLARMRSVVQPHARKGEIPKNTVQMRHSCTVLHYIAHHLEIG